MTGLISRKALIEALKANTMSNGTLINTNTMVAVIEKFPSAPEHTFENCHNATCRRKCRAEGYNKAIDDFANQMEAEVESSAKFIREYDDSIAQKAYYSGLCHAKKIAEQLKAGGIDGNERTDT